MVKRVKQKRTPGRPTMLSCCAYHRLACQGEVRLVKVPGGEVPVCVNHRLRLQNKGPEEFERIDLLKYGHHSLEETASRAAPWIAAEREER